MQTSERGSPALGSAVRFNVGDKVRVILRPARRLGQRSFEGIVVLAYLDGGAAVYPLSAPRDVPSKAHDVAPDQLTLIARAAYTEVQP